MPQISERETEPSTEERPRRRRRTSTIQRSYHYTASQIWPLAPHLNPANNRGKTLPGRKKKPGTPLGGGRDRARRRRASTILCSYQYTATQISPLALHLNPADDRRLHTPPKKMLMWYTSMLSAIERSNSSKSHGTTCSSARTRCSTCLVRCRRSPLHLQARHNRSEAPVETTHAASLRRGGRFTAKESLKQQHVHSAPLTAAKRRLSEQKSAQSIKKRARTLKCRKLKK